MAGDPTARLVVTTEEHGAREAKAEQERLRAELQANLTELTRLRQAHAMFKGTAAKTSEEAKQLKANMDAKRNAIGEASKKILQMGGTYEDLIKKEVRSSVATSQSSQGIKALGSELSKLSPAASDVVGKAGLVAMGWAGAAAAAVALTVGVAGLIGQLVQGAEKLGLFAFAASDAARNERLLIEGMVRTRGPLEGSERFATGLQTAISRVARDVPLARSEVKALFDAMPAYLKRSGDAGEKMLRGFALAKSVNQDFYSLAWNTNMAGRSMLDMAKEAETRWGPVVRKQMLSTSVEATKLRDTVSIMFSGVDVAPVGSILKSIREELEPTRVTGYALKETFASLFTSLGDDATRAQPVIKIAMQETAIAILRGVVAVLTFKNAIMDWIDDHDVTQTNAFREAVDLLQVGLFGVGAMALTAAVGVGLLAGAALLVAQPFIAVIESIKAIQRLKGEGHGWGYSIVAGIAEGIKAGWGLLYDAISGMASGVKTAFKAAFQIHSPSRLIFNEALQIPAAIPAAIDAKMGDVHASIASLVSIPRAAGAAAPGAARGAGGPITIGPFHIAPPAGATAQDLAVLVRQEIERMIEQVCKMLGVDPGEVRLV